MDGSGAWVRVNEPELSEYIVSAKANVIVGFTKVNEPKPRDESEAELTRLSGGVELPSPLAASGANTGTAPSPEISSKSEPKVQVLDVPLNVPPNVVAAPTPEDPAVVTTPAPFVQYAGPL